MALVVVGGKPVYGEEDLMRRLLPNTELDSLRVCGADKAVDLAGTAARAKG